MSEMVTSVGEARLLTKEVVDESDDSDFEEFLTEMESDMSLLNSPERLEFENQCDSESDDEHFDEFLSEVEQNVWDCSAPTNFDEDWKKASTKSEDSVSHISSLKIQLFPDEILTNILSYTNVGKVCKRWSAIKVALSRHRLVDLLHNTCLLPLTTSREIESELFLKCSNQVSKKYLSKGRSLAFNLRDNVDLLQRVIIGDIIPHQLVYMSADELARSELLAQRIASEEKHFQSACGKRKYRYITRGFLCPQCFNTSCELFNVRTSLRCDRYEVYALCVTCHHMWEP